MARRRPARRSGKRVYHRDARGRFASASGTSAQTQKRKRRKRRAAVAGSAVIAGAVVTQQARNPGQPDQNSRGAPPHRQAPCGTGAGRSRASGLAAGGGVPDDGSDRSPVRHQCPQGGSPRSSAAHSGIPGSGQAGAQSASEALTMSCYDRPEAPYADRPAPSRMLSRPPRNASYGLPRPPTYGRPS